MDKSVEKHICLWINQGGVSLKNFKGGDCGKKFVVNSHYLSNSEFANKNNVALRRKKNHNKKTPISRGCV